MNIETDLFAPAAVTLPSLASVSCANGFVFELEFHLAVSLIKPAMTAYSPRYAFLCGSCDRVMIHTIWTSLFCGCYQAFPSAVATRIQNVGGPWAFSPASNRILRSPCLAIAFRAFTLSLTLLANAWVMYLCDHHAPQKRFFQADSKHCGPHSARFFTLWVLLLTSFYFLVALWTTILLRDVTGPVPPGYRIPRLVILTHVLQSILLPSTCFEALVYWLGVFPTDPELSATKLFIHAVTFLVMAMDAFVTNQPYELSDGIFCILFVMVYACWTVVHALLDMPFEDDTLYAALNWNHTTDRLWSTGVCFVLGCILLPIINLILHAIFRPRAPPTTMLIENNRHGLTHVELTFKEWDVEERLATSL